MSSDVAIADSLDVLVIVDNATDGLSINPAGVVSEWQGLRERNPLQLPAGPNLCGAGEPHLAGNGLFYISGEIPRNTPYETGMPGNLRKSDNGWESDFADDERFVCVNVKEKGLFVFSACSHAGIINVLSNARSLFPQVPLYGAMGGLHLSGSTENIIPNTVADLRQFDLKLLAPGHCTGWRSIGAMERAFGRRVAPLAVGKRFIA